MFDSYQSFMHGELEGLFIANRDLLNNKMLRKINSQCGSIWQYLYTYFGLALSLRKKDEFDVRWNTFYEMLNDVLKLTVSDQK